jgi:hypothetical protein
MGAETIYFKVPRYFDAMDLDHTTIYIQWQYTNSQNGQPEQGISHEWVRDIESEDDYLEALLVYIENAKSVLGEYLTKIMPE